MKTEFNYYIPTRIVFGAGKLAELATTPHLPGKKALVVISAGKSMKSNGYLDRTLEYLKQNGVESVIFDKILPNPIAQHVDEGATVARDAGCDFVLGLGGGSSLDSAKSIAVMAHNPGVYWDYIQSGTGKSREITEPVLPIVAVTTTAGTGTEADPWSVITNSETQEKVGWGIEAMFPVLSIVDPELMLTVPPKLTAYQGMDAFFHAVEGYLANVRQPASDIFALESIRLITKYLPEAVDDGSNLEARSAIAWANTLSGMVESTSCCISQHSMEHALSARHPNLPHGAGLVLLSVSYFSCLLAKTPEPERFADIARAMGEDVDCLSEKEGIGEAEIAEMWALGEDVASLPSGERPWAFIAALQKLIAAIGLADLRLGDFGVESSESAWLADNARDAMGFLFELDPCPLSRDDVIQIYERSLASSAG